MKQKVFTLLTLLVLCVTGAWADPVTVGRTLAGTSATSYTVTTIPNTTVAVSDGSVNHANKNQPLKYKSNSGTNYQQQVEYKNQLSDASTHVTAYNSNHYIGFSLTIADGYKFTPSKLNLSLATSANFSYRAEVRDATGNVYYVSDDVTIANYDSNSSTNADKEFSLSNIVLSGTIYVRLYTWFSNSGKYYAPLTFTMTGEIATATTSTISVGKTGDGSVSGGGSGLNDGTFTTLTAVDGSETFVRWTKASDGEWESTSNPLKVLVNGNETYTAVFGAAKTATTTAFSTPTTEVNVASTVTNTATVTGGPGSEIITYSSSDPTVAKVNASTGEVKGLKPGTTTITASYAGNEDYAPSSDSYNITVSNATLTAVSSKFWKFSDDIWADFSSIANGSTIVVDNLEAVGGTITLRAVNTGNSIEGLTFTTEANIGSGSSSAKHFHFKVVGNKRITVFGRSNSGSENRSAEIHVGSFGSDDKEVVQWSTNATASKVVYEYTGGAATDVYVYSDNTINIFGIRVDDILTTVTATVGANGYTTFASSYPLDLTDANRPAGLKAYKATRDGANLTFTALNQTVPAGTGLLLLGETKGGNYDIPVAASGDVVSSNALVGVIAPTAKQSNPSGNYYFVMKKAASESDALAFAPLSTSSAVSIPAGKAYIEVPNSAFSGGANELTISFEEDGGVTGIQNLTPALSKGEGAVFDLQGRRVAQPAKGLYIVNGRKVVIK